MSHSSLNDAEISKLNFEDSVEDSWETWKSDLKFQTKTKTSKRNFLHQVKSSNLEGNGSPSSSVMYQSIPSVTAPLPSPPGSQIKTTTKNDV